MRARIVAGLAVLGLVVAGCADQQQPTQTSPDEATPSPAADSPSVDEATPDGDGDPDVSDETSGDDAGDDAPTSSPTLAQPAAWPAADAVLSTPEAAAEGFVTAVLAGPAILGEFRQGDQRSGELPVLSDEDGATSVERGLLLLRQLAPYDGWFVLGGVSDTHSINSPAQGAEVAAGPVEVIGDVRGGEATLTVTAVVPGTGAVLDQQTVEVQGDGDAAPFAVTLDLAAATPGSMLGMVIQDDAADADARGGFAAVAVVVR